MVMWMVADGGLHSRCPHCEKRTRGSRSPRKSPRTYHTSTFDPSATSKLRWNLDQLAQARLIAGGLRTRANTKATRLCHCENLCGWLGPSPSWYPGPHFPLHCVSEQGPSRLGAACHWVAVAKGPLRGWSRLRRVRRLSQARAWLGRSSPRVRLGLIRYTPILLWNLRLKLRPLITASYLQGTRKLLQGLLIEIIELD
jgi:hypothetical protein